MSSRSGNHLVKPGEGEGTFELCARHPEHARAIMTRPRCRCGEQRGLAHAGFSRHEQRATVTIRDTADDVLQNFSLVPASDQGAPAEPDVVIGAPPSEHRRVEPLDTTTEGPGTPPAAATRTP